MTEQMRFASALALSEELEQVTQTLIEEATAEVPSRDVDFVLLTLSPHFARQAGTLAESLRAALSPRVLIGCTAEGVIARDREVEQRHAVAMLAAHLPDVTLSPFVLEPTAWQQILRTGDDFVAAVAAPEDAKLFVTLGDPFSTPTEQVLDAFNAAYPGVPVIGGMASGTRRPGGNALLLNDRVLNAGTVGVALGGAADVDVVVSQGCRPLGSVYTVTDARENVILALDGEPPLEQVRAMANTLPDEDRELLQSGLFVGRAIDSDTEALGRGDFLIRNVTGVDPESGAMAVGAYVQEGEKIQFHVRDAETAEEDLAMMLTPHSLFEPPSGALLFSCNGRGTRLYGHPDGDVSTVRSVLGDVHLAGFFCAGEIGPIGERNFLHGHTASMVLFRPALEQ